ncbi:MAG: Uma2 family endonuclease [Fimbriimonadales bacterium]|nr:Uma2 family endonuclease [Fimbriimonadales bacterium]
MAKVAVPRRNRRKIESVRERFRLRFTPEQFHALAQAGLFNDNRRYELIEGDIIAMPPEGTDHAEAKSTAVEKLFERRGKGWHRRVESPLRLGNSEPTPDIVFAAGSPHDYRQQHPTTALLIIEVADSSLDYDRSAKQQLYAAHGVQEYWILNLPERVLEVYREPTSDGYRVMQVHSVDDFISPLFEPDWHIQVRELFPPKEG